MEVVQRGTLRAGLRATARAMLRVVAAAPAAGPKFFFCFLKSKFEIYAIQAVICIEGSEPGSDTTVGDNGGSGSRYPGAQRKSMTGNKNPPSVYTRRSDGFDTNGISSSRQPEQVRRKGRLRVADGGACGWRRPKGRRGGGWAALGVGFGVSCDVMIVALGHINI
ncbi:hypothetical protein F511_18550 [Dorcoceras hygrometricum]|uniref:Uncharacterized protein n=1 Tax=Dorcoceras hygrometricum TaxID=472368 RepID=A0A2Z7AQI2_9LAMI|nr:hypothetical protein F511_18550 [Dorcoceras hygrometricum]